MTRATEIVHEVDGTTTRRVVDVGSPPEHRRLVEREPDPPPMLAWTADDGYGTQPDYFALMEARGFRGTLFASRGWVDRPGTDATWGGDTYITSGQITALVDAGHELGSHGRQHENLTLITNREALSDLLGTQTSGWLAETFATPVRVASYPYGLTSPMIREVAARHYTYVRASKGLVTAGPHNPLDVPSVDVQAMPYENVTALVDQIVALRTFGVFLVHGGLDTATLARLGDVMDYAAAAGVVQLPFGAAMDATVGCSWGQTAVSSKGVATPSLRASRVEVGRSDRLGDGWYLDMDEATNEPVFGVVAGGQPIRLDGSPLKLTHWLLMWDWTTKEYRSVILRNGVLTVV